MDKKGLTDASTESKGNTAGVYFRLGSHETVRFEFEGIRIDIGVV